MDIRHNTYWAWVFFAAGFIGSTIMCRDLLDPNDISKTWPFDLWYTIHAAIGIICGFILWKGTNHARYRRFKVTILHLFMGFLLYIAAIIAVFKYDILPFIE